MINTVMLIGKYSSVYELDNDNYSVSLVIKDDSDSDMTIYISINKYVYDMFKKHCSDGDLVGIKGSISIKDNNLVIVASKVTFLSSKK